MRKAAQVFGLIALPLLFGWIIWMAATDDHYFDTRRAWPALVASVICLSLLVFVGAQALRKWLWRRITRRQ